MDTPDPADIPEIGGLDDFASETPASAGADSADSADSDSLMSVVRAEVSDETGAPRPLSRVEAAHARRAASAIATPGWWTLSSVATRCHRTISWLATRSQRAISSVATRSGHAGSSVATGSGRAVSSVATGTAGAVRSVVTDCARVLSTVAAQSPLTVASAAEQGRHAFASVAAHSRRISAAVTPLALRCDSWFGAVKRTVRGARRRFARRPDGTRIPAGELRNLEFEGPYVAAALAVVVVSYGALLLLSWRDPVPQRLAAAPAAVPAVGSPAPVPASTVTTNIALAPVAHAVPATVRPAQARISTASLRAVWNRSDTRSLQRALNNLRSQTLALHRCGMQVTAADSAIAQCDGSSHATYTIDFRRLADRWVIQRVSSR